MRLDSGEVTASGFEHSEHGEANLAADGAASSAPGLDLDAILTIARETAFSWHVPSDALRWARNAGEVLGFGDEVPPATGRAFAFLVDPEHAETRYQSIIGGVRGTSDGEYRVQYRCSPKGRRNARAMWIEEQGRVLRGPGGEPERAEGVMRVINERRDLEERLIYLAEHDHLTGQMNRARLTEEVRQLLDGLKGGSRSAGFLLVAVNDLTLINETYGFDIGDQVIAIVGQRLRNTLRGRDCIGRHSSNKFGVVINSCGRESLEAVAIRLMGLVRDHVVETSVGAVPVTVSIGALRLPEHAVTVRDVMTRAMEALDRARSNRSTGLALYEVCERRDSERRRNVTIADEIIRALNDRRLVVALQPIVGSGARAPELYECLIRLRKQDDSIMSAGEFVPVAEQFGLCRMVDHRVLEIAVDMLRRDAGLKLSVNISAASTAGGEWLSALESFTGGERALTERLTVEITETSAISDIDACTVFVRALQSYGCRVALDDFGAGHTSFRNLKMLGVDIVKIDGAFVENLAESSEDHLFVRTLIELARSFGIETVGEWVGDASTADILEQAGFSYMQGFHFGAPELADASPARPIAFTA